jgi:prophage DNA circulation protein
VASFEEDRIVGSAALWSTLLNIGGVLLITGSLGYAALTLKAYEDRCGSVDECGPVAVETVDATPDETVAEPDRNAVSTVLQQTPAGSRPGPDPVLTAQVERLNGELQDARTRLAEAEAANGTLQSRIAELEQQGTGETAAASELAQCRATAAQARNRYEAVISRQQQGMQNLQTRLRRCEARPPPPTPPAPE